MTNQTGSITEPIGKLYTGTSAGAVRFRFLLLALDLLTISFFVLLSMTGYDAGWLIGADIALAVYVLADLAARFAIARSRRKFFLELTTVADLVVVASLLIAPFVQNLAFLRVLRALRLLRSYHMARDLRRMYPFFRRHETVIHAVINLLVFIFLVSALVLVLQLGRNDQINNYVDALYFTVTTLTTTGFGDIILTGTGGRLLSVAIMVIGVALFLRLLQTIFRPPHVQHRCPDCGLTEHDRDAVHCKHCGRVIDIETDGD